MQKALFSFEGESANFFLPPAQFYQGNAKVAEPLIFFVGLRDQMLIPQLDPLTEQQLLGMCHLQRSSLQTEEALVQGLQQLHRSLAYAVGASALIDDGASVGNYTALMALALDRLDTLESFYRQVSTYSFMHMVMQPFGDKNPMLCRRNTAKHTVI